MAKKSRKARKSKENSSFVKSGHIQLAEILKQFKANCKAGEWEQSLISYRTWCNKANKKRNPRIEGELLFRFSSFSYGKKQYEKATALLKEAEKVYPENRKHCLYCMGISLAGSGQLVESRDIFTELDNSYHKDLITSLLDRDKPFPKNMHLDPAFQPDMIWKFWDNLKNPEAVPTSSNALGNLKDAYTVFSSGQDPSSKLMLLESKTGFRNIAEYLKLLVAVYHGSNIKIRNLLIKNIEVFNNGRGDSLLEIYLKFLLKMKDYKEILVLNKLLRDIKAKPSSVEAAQDTALFYIGLEEIDQGHLEKALEYYRSIKSETSAVLHNKALLFQKMEKFSNANECWTTLCRENKKPRRSDPEELRISYGIMLKYIAENYRQEDLSHEAQSLYKEVLSLNKFDRESLEALFEINTEDGNHHLAFNYAKQLFEMDRSNDEYLFNYASVLLELDRINELIPLYEEACKRNPDSNFYKEGLEFCYVKSALDIRGSKMEELKVFVEKIESLDETKSYSLVYLEGYILHREGQARKAIKKINQAIAMVEEHFEEFHLGFILYEDGFIKQSMELFCDIASCGCPTSDRLTESIIGLLVIKDDRENAFEICRIAEDSLLWDDFTIASLLYDLDKPVWAVEYSKRLIDQEEADEDECFFHLLVLNDIGNGKDTLQYTRELFEKAEANNDEERIYVYKQLIKQIKTRGKFKPSDE
ncbi:MAG: hypothetical protein PF693_15515 [Spirochaetia bacterium]|jgi:tetratricopeptide (TPR) repeat protein|nr:hypothetical protein [Spirochaetia bacterium]